MAPMLHNNAELDIQATIDRPKLARDAVSRESRLLARGSPAWHTPTKRGSSSFHYLDVLQNRGLLDWLDSMASWI